MQVCVVVEPASVADHRNCLATQPVLADVHDITISRGQYGCASRSEDVLSLVLTVAAARCSPCIRNLSLGNVANRQR